MKLRYIGAQSQPKSTFLPRWAERYFLIFSSTSSPCLGRRSTDTWRPLGFPSPKSGIPGTAKVNGGLTTKVKSAVALRICGGRFFLLFLTQKLTRAFGHLNIPDPYRSKRDAIHRRLHILWIHPFQWAAQAREGLPCPTRFYRFYLYIDYFASNFPQEQNSHILLFSYFWSLRTKTSLYRQIHKHSVITNDLYPFFQSYPHLHSTLCLLSTL